MSQVALIDGGALRAAKKSCVCAVDGCEHIATNGRFCARCDEELTALAAATARSEMQAARRRTEGGSLQLSGYIYAAAAIAAEWYFLWETRDFWWGCLQLWFGKK